MFKYSALVYECMKGQSEVISTVLIVAIAITLAVVFIYWVYPQWTNTGNTARSTYTSNIQSSYADVDITAVHWAGTTLNVTVENTGGVTLTKVYVYAGTTQIAYYNNLSVSVAVNITKTLPAKPAKVSVSSLEGAQDEEFV